jgi:F-type H+-transporting ATPase subunit gamma
LAANNMRDIKRRIKSVTSLEHITSAMKLVSAAKLRRAKTTFEKTQEYMCYILDALKEIFHNTEEVPEKYVEGSREIKKTCYIVITSNRGLCGGFNSNVTKEVLSQIKTQEGEAIIVPIGSKGKDYFAKRNYEIGNEYMAPPEEISFQATQLISRPILDMYDNGEIDKVVLVYTSFINAISQQVLSRTLLPFSPEMIEEISTGCVIKETKHDHEVEYEPSAAEVYNYLIPKFVEIMVYGAIVESATCEHAARRIAMENATDNAHQMLGELTLTYNRTRQAAITREIIEIVSGAEALA